METIDTKIIQFLYSRNVFCGVTKCSDIIYRDEFIDKCAANHCGQYNKKWSCPPAIKSIDFYKKKICNYEKILLFSYIGKLRDNYDVELMDEARHKIMSIAYKLKKLLEKNAYDFFMLAAGSCEICKKCTYPNSPCRHPDLLMIPMEALGIDVYEISKKCKLKYYNGKNTITYFCAIIY